MGRYTVLFEGHASCSLSISSSEICPFRRAVLNHSTWLSWRGGCVADLVYVAATAWLDYLLCVFCSTLWYNTTCSIIRLVTPPRALLYTHVPLKVVWKSQSEHSRSVWRAGYTLHQAYTIALHIILIHNSISSSSSSSRGLACRPHGISQYAIDST